MRLTRFLASAGLGSRRSVEELITSGEVRVNGQVGDAEAWFIPAQGFFDHLQGLAADGITIYSTPEQLAARPLA